MRDRRPASGILRLISVVDKVDARLRGAGLQRGRRPERGTYGYRFFDDPDGEFVYFGIWWEFWEEHGYPLCIAILQERSPPSRLDAFAEHHNGVTCVDPEGHWLVAGYGLDRDCRQLIGKVAKDVEDLLRGRT